MRRRSTYHGILADPDRAIASVGPPRISMTVNSFTLDFCEACYSNVVGTPFNLQMKMEEDVHAHHSTCTRERTGSVLHGSRFSRYEAFGRRSIRRKPGSGSLSQFSRLHCILLPQWQTENSAEAMSALRRSRLPASCPWWLRL
jgi:hypothetical protein